MSDSTKEAQVAKAVQALSRNPSHFPPGRQALAELSQEIDVSINVLQEVVAQLAVGLLSFVEPELKLEATSVAEPEIEALPEPVLEQKPVHKVAIKTKTRK